MNRDYLVTGADRQPQRVWSPAIAHTVTKPVIVVVMGVSGSGKSTVAGEP
jgi:ABC-type proline/glycine betaine transport system ATPase subunit